MMNKDYIPLRLWTLMGAVSLITFGTLVESYKLLF